MALKKPRGGNAPSRTATPDELAEFTEAEIKKGFHETPMTCLKCGGSGRYWGPGGLCFECDGAGRVIGRLYTPEKRAALDKAREDRIANKKAKRERARQEVLMHSLATYPEAHKVAARVADDIEATSPADAQDKYGSFIFDVATKGLENGFTDRQAETLVSAYEKAKDRMEKREAEKQELRAAPDGRQEVRGEIVHTTTKDTPYGIAHKMIVLSDDKYKVWVTIPKDLWAGVSSIDELKGKRVEFTATLEVSRKDESFAFGKRPSNARLLQSA